MGEREREEKRKRNKIGERESIHTSISIVMSIGRRIRGNRSTLKSERETNTLAGVSCSEGSSWRWMRA